MNVGRKRTRAPRTTSKSASRASKSQKKNAMLSTTLPRPLKTTIPFNFRYADIIFFDPGLGGNAVHVFSGNGCYDPDVTGVGHQPTGFDQLMAIFDHYVVTDVSIKVIFQSLDESRRQVVGICARDSATTTADWREYVEQGTSTWDYIGTQAGQPKSTQKTNANIGTFLGRKSVLSDPQLKGSASSNPAEEMYWHVWVSGNGADTSGVFGLVTIDYQGYCLEPRSAGLS